MKKLSKRLLSVLLAALLVMTSVPMFAFNAAAADTSALDEAMAAYEQKMNGNFFTNMKAAYDAYVAAAEVKANADASASDIANAASALSAATDNMGEFSGHVANGPVHYGTTDEDPSSERYAGILWADGTGTTAYDTNQGGKAETSTVGITYGAYFYFYYPTNTVLMYDGKTTPVMPIMMGVIDKDSNYNLHPCYVGTYSDDFKLFDYWYGYDDNFVWPATKDWLIGYNASTDVGMDDAVEIDNTSTVRSFMNYLRYAGTPTNTLTTINGMTFYEQHNMSVVGVTTHTDENKDLPMTIPVKIINYKKLLDKLGEVGGRYNTALDKVDDYKEGGLSQLIDALDEATTDPNSFFVSSNGYQACANWIDKSITDLSNITVTMDEAAAQSIDGAQDVLDAFEEKVTSGKYYLNTANVYKLYCRLHACLDAYEYGDGTSAAIGEASEALNAAINAMVEFTPYTPSGTVKMQDDSTAVSDSAYVSGLIGNYTASTSTMSYTAMSGGDTSPGGVYAFVNSPTSVVALYDGSTPIRIPLMTAWHNNMGFTIGTGNRRMMNAVYPSQYDSTASPANDNADFGLTQVWNGHTNDGWNSNMASTPNNVVFNWNSAKNSPAYAGTLAGYSKATYNAANTYSENYTWQGQRSSKIYAYWNFMTYKGGASGFTNGIKTAKVNFYGMSKWPKEAIDTEGKHYFGSTSNPVTTVTIIDYKTPIDTFKANWDAKMAAFKAGNYDEGGYAAVFEAMDAFTGYNGFASATNATNAATVASTLTSLAAATGSATGTENGPEYQALRDKINWYPSAEKYITGMSDPTFWTAESWQALIDAIDAAEGIMTALPSNNAYYYLDPTAATNAANAIQTAYDNLVEAGILIDPAIEAYAALIEKLDDYTFLASDLQTAANAVNNLTTSFYDDGPIGTKVPATDANRAAIANEVSVLNTAAAALTAQSFDKAAYDSYIEAAHRGANDPDAINLTQLNNDIATLENAAFETVHFPHYDDIVGLKANAQTAVDNAWAAVQTDLTNVMQYTVTVVDADGNAITGVGEGTYAYGTEVTINAGTGDYKYDYVSNTGNTDGAHKVKNIGTVDSFTFTVQGNTTITVGAPTDSKPIKVTYKAVLAGDHGASFTIGTDYVASADDIDVNAVKAPSYAFYLLNSKTKGAVQNNEVIVTLNYQLANGLPQYEIYNDATETTETYYFNELVTIDMEDAPAILIAKSQEDYDAWYEQCDAGTFTDKMVEVAAFGSTYTFRAREDLWTIYIDDYDSYKASYKVQKDELGNDSQVYVRSTAQVSGTALVTYNAIALPEDYEIVEAGVLAQYNKTGADLTEREINFNEVGKDQGNDKVRRLKATKVHDEEDNRYSITLNLADGAKVKYRAYVNYLDNEGNAHTVMADATEETIG